MEWYNRISGGFEAVNKCTLKIEKYAGTEGIIKIDNAFCNS